MSKDDVCPRKASALFLTIAAAVTVFICFLSPVNSLSATWDLKTLIKDAGAAPKTVILNAGNWIISANLEVPRNIKLKLKYGAVLTIAAGKVLKLHGLLEAPPAQIFTGNGDVIFDGNGSQRVYPQWWGAKGDGVTEDTVALQTAVNSFSPKGGEIFIPDGTYIVDSVGVKSNITISGNSSKAILKQKKGARYCITTNPNNEKLKPPIDFHPNNIRLYNITFRGTVEDDGFSEFVMLLDIRGSSNIYVGKCNFIGFRGDGLYMDETGIPGQELHNSKITVTGCAFDGVNKNNRNGISVIDCDGLIIEKCSFKNCSRPDMPGAIDIEPDYSYNIVRNIKISQNRFENIGGNNIIQLSITFKLGKLDSTIHNIEIVKNFIEGEGQANGIYVGQLQIADENTQPNDILISDNVVRNTKRAFMIFGFKNIKMLNNIFEDCKNDPYISYSEKNINVRDMKVIGNTFKNLSTEDGVGISIFGVYNLEFKDNIFDNVGKADGTYGNGLFFRRHGGPAEYISIERNTFKGHNTKVAIQREAFNITYPEHNKIVNNVFLNTNKVFLPASN